MIGQVQDIDLKMLRMFRTIARHRGFAAAQTELNVSLPTISNQMKQLEDRLGVRLCERGALGFRLTSHGSVVLKATERLFEAMDEFRDDLSGLAKTQLGEVRLGIIDNLTSNPACKIHEAIHQFQSRLSGSGVSFFIGPPGELESRVLSGALDLAIGLFPSRVSSLKYTPLFHEEHHLYCGVAHPLYELPDERIEPDILSSAQYAGWAYLEPYVSADSDHALVPATGTAYMEGVLCLLLTGQYIGYLPRHFAQRWVDARELRAMPPLPMRRCVEIALISRNNKLTKRAVRELQHQLELAHGVVGTGWAIAGVPVQASRPGRVP
jgi:DNA-binding transcriptional LysR family regulator